MTRADALWIERERAACIILGRAVVESRIIEEETVCRMARILDIVLPEDEGVERKHHCLIEILKSWLERNAQ